MVNTDTNTSMQFTVQHGFDVFLSSDTFYVEIKMNPRARSDPGKPNISLALIRGGAARGVSMKALPISCQNPISLPY